MKRILILFALLVLALPARAGWACLPSPPLPLVSGTDMVRVIKEPGGNYVASWWCFVNEAGASKLRKEQFIVLGKYVDLPKFGAATARVLSAPDPLAAAIVELDAAKVMPAPGSQEMYDGMRLGYLGCLNLVQTTPATAFLNPLPADFCGNEPVPPTLSPYIVSPYPGATYRATYSTSAAIDGVRNTTAVGKVLIVTGGQPTPCDCTLGRLTETSTTGVKTTYCSVGGAAQTVANCRAR